MQLQRFAKNLLVEQKTVVDCKTGLWAQLISFVAVFYTCHTQRVNDAEVGEASLICSSSMC